MTKLKIPLDFEGVDRAEVEAGVYAAVIENLKYRPEVAKDESRDGKAKSAQIAVEYTITGPGDYEGEKLWQNLYMTEKSMYRVKAFFDAFDEEYAELVVDEESGIVLEPDLSGIAVEIKTFIDGQWGNKIDEPPVVMAQPKRRATRAKAEPETDEDDEPEEKPVRSRTRGRRVE